MDIDSRRANADSNAYSLREYVRKVESPIPSYYESMGHKSAYPGTPVPGTRVRVVRNCTARTGMELAILIAYY
eukprot:1788038-Rhodomonas_salina.1